MIYEFDLVYWKKCGKIYIKSGTKSHLKHLISGYNSSFLESIKNLNSNKETTVIRIQI